MVSWKSEQIKWNKEELFIYYSHIQVEIETEDGRKGGLDEKGKICISSSYFYYIWMESVPNLIEMLAFR